MDFHFLRPWWLLALVPAVLLAWLLRKSADPGQAWRGVVDAHLLPHLLVGAQKHGKARPVLLLFIAWVVTVVALAGPAWQREPAPFADDTAVLVIVLKVTDSMQTPDIQPTRQARAVQKVKDLLALRPGAKTALIAYSGSAHRVMPLTADANILGTFAAELSPDIMPKKDGDAAASALKLADAQIVKANQQGWVLWIGDSVGSGESAALAEYHKQSRAPVTVLGVAGEGSELESMRKAASTLGGDFVQVTPDDADVRRLTANTRFTAAPAMDGQHWRDAGYWLVPLLAALTLFWFRPGWMVLPTNGR